MGGSSLSVIPTRAEGNILAVDRYQPHPSTTARAIGGLGRTRPEGVKRGLVFGKSHL